MLNRTISDTVIDAVRAGLDARSGMAHMAVLSGTEVGSAVITSSDVAVPSRGRFLLYSITKTIMAVATLRWSTRDASSSSKLCRRGFPSFRRRVTSPCGRSCNIKRVTGLRRVASIPRRHSSWRCPVE